MAVKDGEPYVREALASVLGQTFADFELLVVDDASSDATVAIVEGLGDPRVRLLRNGRNLGQVPSLNRGLQEARGEIVARLDADDACRPTRLERQLAVLDAEPRVGVVGTWMEAVGERGQRLGWLRKTLDDYVDFVYHTLIMRVYVSHPSAMYRRAPVLMLGGYDVATGPAEDKDLWRKLALGRWDARIVPEALVAYRLHENQLSQTQAAYQRTVDGASQDRFLAELCPGTPPTPVRLLLAGDPDAWEHDPQEALRGLELVLEGARTRLRLDDGETARLRERVVRRLLDVSAARPWHPFGRAVAAYALDRVPPDRRARARAAHMAALALAPGRNGVRRGARFAAARAEALPGVRTLRGPALRSRLARRLYGKLVGSE
jgi:cellulose synthase/poly-beta-1,6-N-acetylglucosamine synthase-like glycosyltransferase